MILAVDIGNYKVGYGVFEAVAPPAAAFAVPRMHSLSASEAHQIDHALAAMDVESRSIRGAAVCSVVPDATPLFERALRDMFGSVMVLSHENCGGMPIRYDPPSDLGPDRIANAIAVYHTFGGPACAVDLGTATTFDVVSAQGEFLGGSIAPGIVTAAQALYEKTARLADPGLHVPGVALGQSTAECLLSGTLLGYGGLVDHLVRLLDSEAGPFCAVVATGGMAETAAGVCRSVQHVRPHLTLEGLNIAYHDVMG